MKFKSSLSVFGDLSQNLPSLVLVDLTEQVHLPICDSPTFSAAIIENATTVEHAGEKRLQTLIARGGEQGDLSALGHLAAIDTGLFKRTEA